MSHFIICCLHFVYWVRYRCVLFYYLLLAFCLLGEVSMCLILLSVVCLLFTGCGISASHFIINC